MEENKKALKDTVEPGVFSEWQRVNVEILAFTNLGIKVAINDEYSGLVYGDRVYQNYEEGQKLKAYIVSVREDGRIDVSFHPKQGTHVFSTTDKIMAHLKASGGSSPFNDKSTPDDIEDEFQVSKKVFKQAIGKLYKQGRIKISPKGLELVKKEAKRRQ